MNKKINKNLARDKSILKQVKLLLNKPNIKKLSLFEKSSLFFFTGFYFFCNMFLGYWLIDKYLFPDGVYAVDVISIGVAWFIITYIFLECYGEWKVAEYDSRE